MKEEVNELEMNKGNMKTQGLVKKEVKEGNVKEEDTEDDEKLRMDQEREKQRERTKEKD